MRADNSEYFADIALNEESKACASCALSYHAFSPLAAMSCRRASCGWLEDLARDWRRLDERIEGLSSEIEVLARGDAGCERLMSVPGIGPIISSAMVSAIGTGDATSEGGVAP
jgi:hypothetical protein